MSKTIMEEIKFNQYTVLIILVSIFVGVIIGEVAFSENKTTAPVPPFKSTSKDDTQSSIVSRLPDSDKVVPLPPDPISG